MYYEIKYKVIDEKGNLQEVGCQNVYNVNAPMEAFTLEAFKKLVCQGNVLNAICVNGKIASPALDSCPAYPKSRFEAVLDKIANDFKGNVEVLCNEKAIKKALSSLERRNIPFATTSLGQDKTAILGLSGTGKTTKLYQYMCKWYQEHIKHNLPVGVALVKVKGGISYSELCTILTSLKPTITHFFIDDITNCIVNTAEDTLDSIMLSNDTKMLYVTGNPAFPYLSKQFPYIDYMGYVSYPEFKQLYLTHGVQKPDGYTLTHGYHFLKGEDVTPKGYFARMLRECVPQLCNGRGLKQTNTAMVNLIAMSVCLVYAKAVVSGGMLFHSPTEFDNKSLDNDLVKQLGMKLAAACGYKKACEEYKRGLCARYEKEIYFYVENALIGGGLIKRCANITETNTPVDYSLAIMHNAIFEFIVQTLRELIPSMSDKTSRILTMRNVLWADRALKCKKSEYAKSYWRKGKQVYDSVLWGVRMNNTVYNNCYIVLDDTSVSAKMPIKFKDGGTLMIIRSFDELFALLSCHHD